MRPEDLPGVPPFLPPRYRPGACRRADINRWAYRLQRPPAPPRVLTSQGPVVSMLRFRCLTSVHPSTFGELDTLLRLTRSLLATPFLASTVPGVVNDLCPVEA